MTAPKPSGTPTVRFLSRRLRAWAVGAHHLEGEETLTGSTEPKREWNPRVSRGAHDERPRRGLRALFTPSVEGVDEVEELIDAHGRELAARVRSLQEAITDLDEREERVQRLRATIETLLRDGSADLDERHAEIALAAQGLAAREEELARAETELEERRSELGAVELRRAAVDSREEALERRQVELERIAGELRERADLLDERSAVVETAIAHPITPAGRSDAHVLVVPRDGYRLVDASGPVPAPGTEVSLDGVRYRVARTGPSPLPRDDRRCGFLET